MRRRHRGRHLGFRTFVEWTTIAFVVVCLLWTVVMLFLYEWHKSHPRSN